MANHVRTSRPAARAADATIGPGDRHAMPAVKDLSVVILCGGLGTRLREETEFKPRPMVEIGNRPILWHIMKHYRHFGARDFVLCLGYKGEVIRDYFLNYPLRNTDIAIDLATGEIEPVAPKYDEDWRVTLAETGRDTMTGARMHQAIRYAKGELFFATYGDGLADIDLDRLLAHHLASGKLATVTAVRPSSRFGELSIAKGLVRQFREKPQVTEGWINGGFFVFDRRAFDLIRPDDNVSLEEAVLESLAARGELAVYQHFGFWQSMDTYREMQLLNDLWQGGAAPWMVWRECRMSA
jgi:glucose-1-phosphate cytidylyltransferase